MTSILIVDDEPDVLKSVKKILTSEKFTVSEAVDGNDCIKKAEQKKYDLIILDLLMVGPTPKELLVLLKGTKNKDTKIIFLTAVPMSPGELGSYEKYNVVDYISKPFDLRSFIMKVKSHLY